MIDRHTCDLGNEVGQFEHKMTASYFIFLHISSCFFI